MKGFLLALGLLLCVGVVYAEDTSRGNYKSPIFQDWLNTNDDFYHTHQYDKYEDPVGVGVDAKVLNFPEGAQAKGFDSVEAQGRYDFENEAFSIFGVLQLDLTKLYQKR